ncbi:hypothetical protein DOCECA_17360 [Pseudomonas sp. E102]
MTSSEVIEAPYRGLKEVLRYCGAWSRKKTSFSGVDCSGL